MRRQTWRFYIGLLLNTVCVAQTVSGPRTLTWQETEQIFRANNPSLLAGKQTIDEAKADEITAYLRPNPDFTFTVDGTQIAPSDGVWRPFSGTFFSPGVSYLHERRHKRELRLASAQQATEIAVSAQDDLARNLIFNLRDSFVRVLLAKAVVQLSKDNLATYDKQLAINHDRFNAGGIAKVDLQRLELQRIQFVSDLETAQVNLRTAKIDLQALIRDRTPIDQFDVNEEFGYTEPTTTLPDLEKLALSARPDLKEAAESLEKAKTDHSLAIANGSTDPTFGAWYTHNGSFNNPAATNTLGLSISFPLRIFDRNQGDKLHTQIEIDRSTKLRDQAEITAVHDIDSAYATLQSTLELLRPYKTKYLPEASEVRETVAFAYGHGAASLLDFLDAQKQYRDTELSYLNLVGAYLSAANQVNFSVGQEVIR